MNEKWDEFQGKLDLVRGSGKFELSAFEISGSTLQIKVKKACEVNRANIFCRKNYSRRERDLPKHLFFTGRLSVMPRIPTNKGKL